MLSEPPTAEDIRAAYQLVTKQRETGVSEQARARLFAMGAVSGPPYELTARGRFLFGLLLSLCLASCGGEAFEYVEGGSAELGPEPDALAADVLGQGDSRADAPAADALTRPDSPTSADGKSPIDAALDVGALDAGALDDRDGAPPLDGGSAHDGGWALDAPAPPVDAPSSSDAPSPGALCCIAGPGKLAPCAGGAFGCYPAGTSCGAVDCTQNAYDGASSCRATGCPSSGPSCASGSSACSPGAACFFVDDAGPDPVLGGGAQVVPGSVGVCP